MNKLLLISTVKTIQTNVANLLVMVVLTPLVGQPNSVTTSYRLGICSFILGE